MTPFETEYDLIVFGATGYTGKYCIEHIVTHLPTNLKWAVSGRSASKLSSLVEEVKPLNPNRREPGVEVATLNADELNILARKTRLIINTVGPYHLYGTMVVEACAKNGTHYLDVTGEVPWVYEMIQKYHALAKTNLAIIIPEIGLESSPADLLAWSIVDMIRKNTSTGTREVTATLHDIKMVPSGGTLATALSLFDHYSLAQFAAAMKPWALSPVPHPQTPSKTSLLTKITGVKHDPDLGILTSAITGETNRAIVQRSWGLHDSGKHYGANFEYHEYATVRNSLVGTAIHLALLFGMAALATPPIRWLLKKFVYQPGQGPSRASVENDYVEYRAIGTADRQQDLTTSTTTTGVTTPQRAMSILHWDGSIYRLTGVFLVEAAMVLLSDDALVERLGGGVLTPACLGQSFLDRLRGAGLKVETHMMVDGE
ncbi:hypothetical protein MMC09_002692 [Bachmanniomyces sp. S44760]|nr:hypothetical protein [Bachmanniomyces sp. S44760]